MKILQIGTALALIVPPMLGASACATTRPAVEQTSDATITGRVGRRLTADADVKRYEIDVDTLDGVVYLRGKVDSETMKASAERIARNTDGVRQVVNELIVDANREGDASDGDVAIKSRVGTALSGDDDVRRVNIDVDVLDGVVTLSGVVHNESERSEAERLAREQEGVRDVKNDLKVEQLREGDPEKLGKSDDDDSRDEGASDGHKDMDKTADKKKSGKH
jgi:hyperosmotically inducible protein